MRARRYLPRGVRAVRERLIWFRVRIARRVHSNTNALPVCVSLAQTLRALVFIHWGSEVTVVVVCGDRCTCAG